MANYKRTLKRFTALAFLVFAAVSCFAQKQDYIWFAGYESYNGYDTTSHHWFGITQFDFNQNPMSISYDSLGMNFSRTNVSYCDSDGSLQFYSNGIYIGNSLDEKIENSDSMNWGALITQFDPSIAEYGYRNTQGILAIENPSQQKQYYLIHSYLDTSATLQLYCKRTLATLLDMNLNGGHGAVLYKNQTIIENNLGGDLTACRHANGRDWWFLVNKRYTNCYYRLLLDNTGIHLQNNLTCSGDSLTFGTVSSSVFSPDGSKFAVFSVLNNVNIFDFDRCNGELSNPVVIPISSLVDSQWYSNGAAISPNNRFLYIGATTHVYQYDLFAADIPASVVVVATYDGSRNPFGSYFHTMQIGPDGKIYESCGNGEDVYHVIDRPDEKGDSCLFRQHGISLITYSGGVPNFPNYRLGALPGSPCDTLTGLNETARALKEKILKVFPNPAGNMVTVDYGFTDWSKGDVRLTISDELGRVVYEQSLPKYSGFQNINVSTLAAGTYFVYLKRNGNTVAGEKMMKE